MSYNIALLAPFRELADAARRVAVERSERIAVFEGIENYPTVDSLPQSGFDVIITRGPMVDILRQQTSIPILCCDPSGLDFFKAFAQAKNYGSVIRLITSWEVLFDKELIEQFLGISIQVSKLCKSKEEVHKEVKRASLEGIKVVVGGAVTAEIAPLLNLHFVRVSTGSETIIESIEKAKETVRISREKQAEMERLRIILDLEQNGIISINHEKIVTVFNSVAEEMTGLKKEEVIGKSIEAFFPNSPMLENLKNNRSSYSEIVNIGKLVAVNNRVPILVNDHAVGVVSTYQEVNKLQEVETKVRKEINKKGFIAKHTIGHIVGESKKIKEVGGVAREYAATDSTILITGETGTGKGLLAQGIHLASRRADGPFVAVNCSALPDNLLESELFGYEEGAFTGARRRGKQGLFELAHRGTIFLDEIAGTSRNLQSRLLRVVEEKEVMRVGGDQVIPLDVRIIAATNQDLRKASLDGSFRSDLYYRLHVLSIKLPALRERSEDIIPLYRYFLNILKISSREADNLLTPDFAKVLIDYPWPGNVRELEHFAEKTAALMRLRMGTYESLRRNLSIEIRENQQIEPCSDDKTGIYVHIGSIEEMESEIIRKLYRKYCGDKTRLAKQLKISRTTLWKKLGSILNEELEERSR